MYVCTMYMAGADGGQRRRELDSLELEFDVVMSCGLETEPGRGSLQEQLIFFLAAASPSPGVSLSCFTSAQLDFSVSLSGRP